jgi:phospholipid-binding lipoprotein MlaA
MGRVPNGVYMGAPGFTRCFFGVHLDRGAPAAVRNGFYRFHSESPRKTAPASGADYKGISRRLPAILLTIGSLVLFGCATNPSATPNADPLESFNRDADDFNMAVDRAFLEPLSKAYARVTPDPIQASITNFFDNLRYVGVIINVFLQGKIRQGGQDAGRFLVNTTLGIGGLFDIASRMNLPRHEEDLGQTLCTWGVPQGPYIVLPLLGPSTVRDLPSIPAGIATSLLTLGQLFISDIDVAVIVSLGALDVVNTRANLSSAVRLRNQALDPYIFLREAYLQRRRYLCYDGNPPLEDFNDLDEFETDGLSP